MSVRGLDLQTRRDEFSMVLFVPGERRRDVDCDVNEALDERAPCDFSSGEGGNSTWGAVHFFVNWRCIRNCRCNYRNEIDQSDELDDLKHRHQRRRQRDDA